MNKTEEELMQEAFRKAITCQCCGVEVEGFGMQTLRGIGYSRNSRACKDCHEEYFEQVKAQYFVEEYKDNNIYKWNNHYFPYWNAEYAYDTVEDCRTRIDDAKVASVNMNMFHVLNSMSK